jgi:hypothetical protein
MLHHTHCLSRLRAGISPSDGFVYGRLLELADRHRVEGKR